MLIIGLTSYFLRPRWLIYQKYIFYKRHTWIYNSLLFTGYHADVESILKQPRMPKKQQILMFGGPATSEVQHLAKIFLKNSLLITRKRGRSGSNMTILVFFYTPVELVSHV